MTSITELIRPHLANIKTYEPVDPPELLAKRAGIPEDQIIKLNGNENPFGGSPKASEALGKIPLHVYPDSQQRRARRALAEYTGLDVDHIIVGAGSDELIDLLFRLMIAPGDSIVDFEPTFGMYGFGARVSGAETRLVQRDELFDIDMDGARDAVDSNTKIIFVSSPNNPTGNLVSEAQVRALLDLGPLVVIDEAYYEFCGDTVAGMIPQHENLCVLRTMSKWAGLAGLRVGYALASPKLIAHIIDIKSPYNMSTAAEAALIASLEDAEALLERVDENVAERGRLFGMLEAIPGVKPWTSGGNFILCEFEEGRKDAIYEGLADRGIFVREFSSERLRNAFRMSVGTPEQSDAVVAALNELV